MWSPYYKYYQIKKDKSRSEKVDTKHVKSIIENIGHFENDGILIYKSNKISPWMTITLIQTDDGNYSIHNTTNFKKINLIEVITSRRPETNENWYLEILKNIANKLKWEITLEEYDDDNENVLIDLKE